LTAIDGHFEVGEWGTWDIVDNREVKLNRLEVKLLHTVSLHQPKSNPKTSTMVIQQLLPARPTPLNNFEAEKRVFGVVLMIAPMRHALYLTCATSLHFRFEWLW
jgi:hypothetical protein